PHMSSITLYAHDEHLKLHSFPTRRSSDLNQMDNAKNLLSSIWGNIKSLIGDRASQILSDIKTKFTDIKTSIQNRITEAKNQLTRDRKSTRLNSSHVSISYAVFCLKKKSNK